MNPNHIATWREYLAEQMQERYGVARQEAKKAVTEWLRSLSQNRRPGLRPPSEQPRSAGA
jgi:hypothetical protein